MKPEMIIFGVMKKSTHAIQHKALKWPVSLKIVMILLMILRLNTGWGQTPDYVIELGLSYDDAFVNRFTNEDEARKHITQLIFEVNEIFRLAKPLQELKITVKPRQIRKISGLNHTNHFEYHKGIAQYWTFTRKGNDLCFTPDMAHHITGLPNGAITLGHAHTGGTCKLYQRSITGGASHSRFDNISAIKSQAYVMVRLLLHQVGLGKENCAGMPSGNHCLMSETLFTFNENHNYQDIWMSNHFKNSLQGLLNSADLSCLLSKNQQEGSNIDSECQSCDGKVTLYSQNTKYINEFDFSCLDEKDPGDCSHSVQTTFNNSCDLRTVKVEVYYNDNYIDSITLPEGFSTPVNTSTNDYNKIVTSQNIELKKGSAHSSVFKIYFNGNTKYNIIAGQNGTAMRVRYVYVSGVPFTSGNTDASYRFLFPYVLDKRGQKIVNASEILTPDQAYNFCSGIRHDIYIEDEGELRFDYPATFCNVHFIMGKNSKIIIEPGRPLHFENCTFRTCDPDVKWYGIELEVGSHINVSGHTRFFSAQTAIKSLKNNVIKIIGANDTNKRVEFHKCKVGIEAKNGGYLDVMNCLFEKPHIAIDLLDIGAMIESSVFNAGSDGFGIRTVRNIVHGPPTVSISKQCTFNNHFRGIYAKNMRLSLDGVIFKDNYSPVLIIDVPNISHSFKNVTFSNSRFDAMTVRNSTSHSSSIPSRIDSCHFLDGKQTGLNLSGTKYGWQIMGTFQNNKTGIRMSNSSENLIWNSNFNYDISNRNIGTHMNFIHLSYSDKNRIGRDEMTKNHFNILIPTHPTDMFRHIFLENGGINNKILCNVFTNGNRGINPWGLSLTDIAGNRFNTIDRGLYYGLLPGDVVTTTGIQEFNNNSWNLADPDKDIGATHLGANSDLVGQSLYHVHSDSREYLPNFEAIANDWFDKPSNPETPFHCSSGFQKINTRNGLFQMLTSGDGFQRYKFGTGMLEAVRDYIYDAILAGETFGESSETVASYMDTLISNDDLYIVKQAEQLLYGPSSNQQDIEVGYSALQAALNKYYAMDGLSETSRDSLLLVISQLSMKAQDAYEIYRTELDRNLVLVSDLLSSVSKAHPYWYNKARTLAVLAKKWQGIEPDPVQLAMLADIANLCPPDGGKGVYIARGILDEYETQERMFDDLKKCSLISKTFSVGISTVDIFPNPTRDWVIIEANTNIQSIEVYDFTGKLIFIKEYQDTKKIEIRTLDLQPGMYFVTVKLKDNHFPEIRKLIVIP